MSQLNELLAALHVFRQLDRIKQDEQYGIVSSSTEMKLAKGR